MSQIHSVSEKFCLDKFFKARLLTKEAVSRVKSRVEIGMSEKDGLNLIDEVLNQMGAQKKWHPNKFRIGGNTIKSFRDKSNEGIVLQENDLFFLDIGPVWEDHEGDYGETFVSGNNKEYEQIIKACHSIFEETAKQWRENRKSGIELYQFAKNYTQSLGYKFNDRMNGHRIGDFPHHLFYKGPMIDLEETPCDKLWVLEIHILDKESRYGAFYEDILQL